MIWIADNNADVTKELCHEIYRDGFFVCNTGYRMLERNVTSVKTDAVIVPRPYEGGKPPLFGLSFSQRHPDIPVIYMFEQELTHKNDRADCYISPKKSKKAKKMMMLKAIYDKNGSDLAVFRCKTIRDCIFDNMPSISSVPLPLTQHERMILKYLLCSAPEPVSPKELLKYAMFCGSNRKVCNVVTHICRINQKSSALVGYNIIRNRDGLYELAVL